jgi:alkanesulfonate monooxygenase SsuD/methylene tetrahydromethanopterin reductase-like flavin-dependent oxidoreductase (luciferase family)
MRPLLVGIQLPEIEWEVPFPEVLEMAKAAEEVGFDSLWLGDHLLYDTANGPRGPWEVWTSLAAIAAVTNRILIGPLVASTSFHAPAMLAKQAATVDAISNGRLILGLGAGWNEREYTAFGFPFDNRVSRFEEAFTIIRSLLADGVIDFHGRYYEAKNCVLHPRATQLSGPPLMVGSAKPRMLSITLPYVSSWNVWFSDHQNSPEKFAALKATVDEAIVGCGRAITDVTATCAVYIQLGGSGRAMVEGTEPLRGTPRELADHLRAFAVAGAAHVQLVVDPITRGSIEALSEVLHELDQT